MHRPSRARWRCHRGRRRGAAALAALVAVGCVLSACTATVSGTGSIAAAPGSAGAGSGSVPAPFPLPSEPAVPSPPGGPQPAPSAPSGADVQCPTVRDPADGIEFRCITGGMTSGVDPLWNVSLTKSVETGWVLAEGAVSIPVGPQVSLQQVTGVVRDEMVQLQSWGPDPGVRTLTAAARTVAGASAWELATEFTLQSAFRTEQKLKVRTERTWIVALRVDDSRIAVWYVTLPDLVKNLWPRVPALIDGIRRS